MMLAVLPRQQTDDLGGELFVEAYQRHLGRYSDEAISFLADKAIARCRWFPTVSECLEIISEWRRVDEHTLRKDQARRIAGREDSTRSLERHRFQRMEPITQAEVDAMPDYMIGIGLKCGALDHDESGNVRPAPPFEF